MATALSILHLIEWNRGERNHISIKFTSSPKELQAHMKHFKACNINSYAHMGDANKLQNPNSRETHIKWLINNFPHTIHTPVHTHFPRQTHYPKPCAPFTHPQIQECRLLGTLLGGTSNKGTVPLAPPPGPPSPSSAVSRSSGTWRLLILDTQLQSKLRVTRT